MRAKNVSEILERLNPINGNGHGPKTRHEREGVADTRHDWGTDEVLGLLTAPLLDLVDEGGWVTVPLHVSGTLENPKVTADAEALRAMGRRAVREAVRQQVEKGVSKAPGKLFNRR